MWLSKTNSTKKCPNQKTIAGTLISGALFLFSLCMNSCDRNEVFYQFRSFDNSAWHKDSIARFDVNITDTIHAHNVFIELRNNDSYPYQNIWLFVSVKYPTGEMREDTIHFDLADNSGKWYGKGFSLYELSIPYETDIRYPRSGDYTYSIKHGMRDDLLKGISDAGVKITNDLN